MSRTKKLALGFVGFILILVLIGYFAFPSKKIKQYIETTASTSLGCPVKIGAVSPSFVGVTVSAIELESCKALGIESFKLASLGIQLKVMPLLEKKMVFKSILIDGPNIVYASVEEPNKAIDVKKDAEKDIESETSYSLDIQQLSIRKGKVLFKPDAVQSYFLNGIKGDFSFQADQNIFNLNHKVDVQEMLLTTPMGTFGKGLSLNSTGVTQVNQGKDNLEFEKFEVQLGDLKVDLKGMISKYSSEKPNLDLKFSGDSKSLKSLVSYVPSELLPEGTPNDISGMASLKGFAKGAVDLSKDEVDLSALDHFVGLNISDGKIAYQNPKFEGKDISLQLESKPNLIEIKSFKADLVHSRFDAKGTYKTQGLKSNFNGDLKFSVDLSEIAKFNSEMKHVSGKTFGDVAFSGSDGYPNFSGTVNLENISWLDKADPLAKLKHLDAVLKLDQQTIAMNTLKLQYGKTDGTGTGKMSGIYPEQIRKFSFNLNSKNVYVDDFMDPEEETSEEEPVDFSYLSEYDGQISVQIGVLHSQFPKVKNVKSMIQINRGKLEISNTTLEGFGGKISASLNSNLLEKKPHFKGALDVKEAEVSSFLNAIPQLSGLSALTSSLSGNFNTNLSFDQAFTEDFDPIIKDLFAKGKFSMGKAKLQGHPIQDKLSSFLKSDSLKKLDVDSWAQAFEIKDGAVHVKGLDISAAGLGANFSGTQGLTGELDLAATLNIPKSWKEKISLPDAASSLWSVSPGDFLKLPLNIGGTLQSPKMSLNESQVQDQVAQGLKSKVDKKIDSKKDELKDNLKEKLAPKLEEKTGKSLKKIIPKKEKKDLKKKLKGLF